MEIKTNTIELQKIMIENGIKTKVELARLTGINRNTIQKILNGTKQPSSATMVKLTAVLGMQPEVAGRIFFNNTLRNA